MRTEKYTCDRCGKRADGAVSVYWYELPLRQAYDLTVRDLCPSCAEELRAWLGADGGPIAGKREEVEG
jgi:hypothetical protein